MSVISGIFSWSLTLHAPEGGAVDECRKLFPAIEAHVYVIALTSASQMKKLSLLPVMKGKLCVMILEEPQSKHFKLVCIRDTALGGSILLDGQIPDAQIAVGWDILEMPLFMLRPDWPGAVHSVRLTSIPFRRCAELFHSSFRFRPALLVSYLEPMTFIFLPHLLGESFLLSVRSVKLWKLRDCEKKHLRAGAKLPIIDSIALGEPRRDACSTKYRYYAR